MSNLAEKEELKASYASKEPYALPQPPNMVPDLVHTGVLSTWLDDDNLWIPVASKIAMKPVVLNASAGYYVNILRVRRSGVITRHRHSGPVHAIVLRGRWHYLEHDWVAEESGYAFEPPGETHTLCVPDDVPEMITLFHVSGGYTYVDTQGKALGYEDVFTKIETCRKYYTEIGLGADYVNRFIR